MAITRCLTDSFLLELTQAVHTFGTDNMRLAFYLPTANLGKSTTAYTSTGEIPNGGSYSAGGYLLAPSVTPTTTSNTTLIDIADISKPNITQTDIAGALLYKFSTLEAIAVMRFDPPVNAVAEAISIVFPTPAVKSCFIRLAQVA